jgi:hypothetical protein
VVLKVENCPKRSQHKSIGVYVSDIIGQHFQCRFREKC